MGSGRGPWIPGGSCVPSLPLQSLMLTFTFIHCSFNVLLDEKQHEPLTKCYFAMSCEWESRTESRRKCVCVCCTSVKVLWADERVLPCPTKHSCVTKTTSAAPPRDTRLTATAYSNYTHTHTHIHRNFQQISNHLQ